MAAAYHSGLFVTPHYPRHRLYFPKGGALYFTPRVDKKASLALQPKLSRLLQEGDPLRDLVAGARARGLGVHAWLVATHNVTLLSELAHTYGVDGIDLESLNYLGFPHDFHHEKDLAGLDGEANFLLSVCFCSSCREKAEAAGIQAGYPTCLSPADVRGQVSTVARSGSVGMQVYHYGLMRRENMLCLQQAFADESWAET